MTGFQLRLPVSASCFWHSAVVMQLLNRLCLLSAATSTIQSWNYREAAVNAFGSILDGPDPATLLRLVEQAIGPLIERISDSHVAVRDTAVWAVGRVCDLCVELVSKPDIIKLLLPGTFSNSTRTTWHCKQHLLATYSTAVAQGGTDDSGEPETFILSPCFKQLIDELIKTSERTDANVGLRNAAYEALMELVKNSPKDCYLVVKDTTVIVLKKMEELMNVEATLSSATDRAQLRDLISQLCAMLQSVLRKFHEPDAIAVSEPIMRALFQIINRYQGKDNGAVIEEALMAVSALITVLKGNFSNFMPAFKPILMQALSNYADKDVCINAMGVITDLCTVLEKNVSLYSDEFVQCLVGILNNENADKLVKCYVIQLLGDLINALGHHYTRYLEVTMVYVCNAVVNSNVPVQPDDYDQVEYINTLRESCIVVFTAIAQSFSEDQEQRRVIENYFPVIEQLVKSIASSQPPAADSLLASTISLIGDLIVAFGAAIAPFVESDYVNSIIARLRRSKHSKAKTAMRWVMLEMERMRRR
ncbi:Importin N-terminal domain-containing protein [Aphelenchoides bicaudatus]|nr:Importin N-terminal domain-containing protein [Aphelenchoides bicaudatus]